MERTIVGRYVSAQLLTMLAAMAMAASGLLPISAPAYEVVWSMFLPLASVLFMLDTRLQKLGPAESATLKAFVAGAFGTMLGTVVAWVVIGRG